MDVSSLPSSGELLISAFFRIHEGCSTRTYIQNESRRLLRIRIPAMARKAGLDLAEYLFAILSHTEDGLTKSVGVAYSFMYGGLDARKYTEFHSEIQSRFEKPDSAMGKMWSDWDMLVSVPDPEGQGSVPSSGQIVVRTFSRHKTTRALQEKARDALFRRIPQIARSTGFVADPLLFGVLRHVESGVTKPVGVMCSFSFTGLNLERYRLFRMDMDADSVQNGTASNAAWKESSAVLFSDVWM